VSRPVSENFTAQGSQIVRFGDPTQDEDDVAGLEFKVGDKKAHSAHGQPMAQVRGGPVNIW